MTELPQERNRFQPPEAFFDPLPPLLTQAIAKVPRRPPVDGPPAIPLQVLCDMRRSPQVATLSYKISRVEALVASHRDMLFPWDLLQHHQRGISFCGSIGHKHFRVHNQPIPVFHQQVAAVTQLGLLALALTCHLGLRIGLRRMRLIRAPLPAEVYRRIALWSAKTSCSRRNARGSVQMARIFLTCVQQLKCLCEAEWACSRPTLTPWRNLSSGFSTMGELLRDGLQF